MLFVSGFICGLLVVFLAVWMLGEVEFTVGGKTFSNKKDDRDRK
jgi:hypothetical protein